MNRSEEQFEEELDWEKRKQKKGQEAGKGKDGEPSAEALKRWFLWAGLALGICLLFGLILAAISSARNKKEAVRLEVDFGDIMEFRLNRKGMILEAGKGGDALVGKSLEQGLYGILDLLLENGQRLEGEVILMTLRPSDSRMPINVGRLVRELEFYTEAGLKKKQSNVAIYVAELTEKKEIQDISWGYGVSMSRAAFIEGLIHKNESLEESDAKRLAGLSLKELAGEVSERKYDTSFDLVTAKKIYEKKAEGTEAVTTAETAKETEKSSERETETTSQPGLLEKTESSERAEPQTTVQEPTEIQIPEETTAVLETSGAALEETTAVLETSGAALEETTAVLETTGAALEETITVPETTAAALETTTAVSETTATVPMEPESTESATVPTLLEVLPVSPEEASLEIEESAAHPTDPGNSQEPPQSLEVVPVPPGYKKGPGY